MLPDEHPAALLSQQQHGAAADGAAADAAAAAAPPLPPLAIPEEGLPPSERWVLQTFATVERRCRRQGIHTGVTYFEESWL